ncbi:type I-E CRISPR-associated protein Cas6/Cse3/CasE [Streptomyces pristinaespiralis]|uniref:type I-E CRISPR-associated protein Cas6/Cse3/CasE n=1 Tax=Streptomyces pristinaespiralis TaxID=38300 RepID=UPI00340DB26A
MVWPGVRGAVAAGAAGHRRTRRAAVDGVHHGPEGQGVSSPQRAVDGEHMRLVRQGSPRQSMAVRMLPAVTSPGPHKSLRIARAEIRGTLTVTDPAALVDAMTQGIGHGRAYSCGLLLTR